MTRVVIIQGHPTPDSYHFCHALAEAYAQGAAEGGHEVCIIPVAELDFPLLHSKDDWEGAAPPPAIAKAHGTLAWAEHLVIIYPLWLGGMPALLKGFMEQAFRPAFMTGGSELENRAQGPLVPDRHHHGHAGLRLSLVFRRAQPQAQHPPLVGIGPNRHTLIGMIEAMSDAKRQPWLATMRKLGTKARKSTRCRAPGRPFLSHLPRCTRL